MAVLDPPGEQLIAAAASESIQAFAELITNAASVPSVRKVGLAEARPYVDVWILLDEEDLDGREQLYGFEREMRRKAAGSLPLNVHVVSLDALDEDRLPRMTIVFERR